MLCGACDKVPDDGLATVGSVVDGGADDLVRGGNGTICRGDLRGVCCAAPKVNRAAGLEAAASPGGTASVATSLDWARGVAPEVAAAGEISSAAANNRHAHSKAKSIRGAFHLLGL